MAPTGDSGGQRFVGWIDLGLINRLVWPLLMAFIVLGFFDTLTTLIAYSSARGFIELNPFAAAFFRLGFQGFMLAEITKDLPAFPLTYMAALRERGAKTDYQVALLKTTALVVLVAADTYLTMILSVNNVPRLIGLLF